MGSSRHITRGHQRRPVVTKDKNFPCFGAQGGGEAQELGTKPGKINGSWQRHHNASQREALHWGSPLPRVHARPYRATMLGSACPSHVHQVPQAIKQPPKLFVADVYYSEASAPRMGETRWCGKMGETRWCGKSVTRVRNDSSSPPSRKRKRALFVGQ